MKNIETYHLISNLMTLVNERTAWKDYVAKAPTTPQWFQNVDRIKKSGIMHPVERYENGIAYGKQVQATLKAIKKFKQIPKVA